MKRISLRIFLIMMCIALITIPAVIIGWNSAAATTRQVNEAQMREIQGHVKLIAYTYIESLDWIISASDYQERADKLYFSGNSRYSPNHG